MVEPNRINEYNEPVVLNLPPQSFVRAGATMQAHNQRNTLLLDSSVVLFVLLSPAGRGGNPITRRKRARERKAEKHRQGLEKVNLTKQLISQCDSDRGRSMSNINSD